MKSRNALFSALTLGLMLSAPLAFAQDQQTTAADAATQATEAAATEAPQAAQTAADPAQQAADPTAQATSPAPADPAAGAQTATETKQITWSDLDSDKDGKLTKTEASSVQALTQVFDDADADKDGALTPDEYKAFVAKSQGEATQPAPQNEG